MQKLTAPTKQSDIKRTWHIIDVQDQILGRSATHIAEVLMGKNKSYFARNMDCGDHVVVINAKEVKTTGKKEENKVYTRYSGYPGGLKKETLRHLRERRPEEVVRHAVSGMLPHNRLHDKMLARLHVFAGAEHKFGEKFNSDQIGVKKEESK